MDYKEFKIKYGKFNLDEENFNLIKNTYKEIFIFKDYKEIKSIVDLDTFQFEKIKSIKLKNEFYNQSKNFLDSSLKTNRMISVDLAYQKKL